MAQTAAASPSIPRVDSHLLKFSQGGTVLLSALAFILQQPILVAVAAAILLISALVPAIGPFRLIYRGILVPLHILKPRIVEDDPAPHRFAQAIGATSLSPPRLVLYLTHRGDRRLGARPDRLRPLDAELHGWLLRGLLCLLSPWPARPDAARALRWRLPLARRLERSRAEGSAR